MKKASLYQTDNKYICHREESEGRRGDPDSTFMVTGLLRRFTPRNDKYSILSIFLSIILFCSACVSSRAAIKTTPDMPKWEIAKRYSTACEQAPTRGEKLALSKQGIAAANECITAFPERASCYYYHAVNTGLYYQTKVIGYQKGLQEMIKDCEKVNKLDNTFAYAGGYRMMGIIYTEVPATSMKKEPIVKDLDKAIGLLNMAVEIAPNYPENHLALAKAFREADMNEKAKEALNKANELMPNWKSHLDYKYWKKESKKLSRRINK